MRSGLFCSSDSSDSSDSFNSPDFLGQHPKFPSVWMIFSLPCQSAIKNIQPLEKYGHSAPPHTPQTSTGWIFIPLTCRPATENTQPMGNTDADDPLTRHKHPASGGFAPLRGIHSKSRAQTPDFPMRRYSGSCNYGMRTVFAQERKARYQRRRFHADAPRRRRATPSRPIP